MRLLEARLDAVDHRRLPQSRYEQRVTVITSEIPRVLTPWREPESNLQFRKCLSDLSNLSPPFVISDTTLDLYLQGIDVGEYKEMVTWMDNPSSGIITTAGSNRVGKGLLAGAVFRELQKRALCAAYFPFSFGGYDSHRASATCLLASVTLQLLNADPERYSRIAAMHEAMDTCQTPWTQAALVVAFQALLDTKNGKSPVYIIVDGLHRCDSSLAGLFDILSAIFGNDRVHTKLKIALFYQERDEIIDSLASLSKYTVPGPDLAKGSLVKPLVQSLADYVVKRRPHLSPLRGEILGSLVRCKDLSQLALTLHSLRNLTTNPCSIGSARSVTGNLPPTIQEAVSSRFRVLQDWGRVALGWICNARRPLSLAELMTAVAITDRDADFTASLDPEGLPLDAAGEMARSLGGLVMLEDGGIVFTTDTIKTHFLDLVHGDKQQPVIPSDVQIAAILIKYISWVELVEPLKQARDEEPHIQPPEPLFELAPYAMEFWPHHYRTNYAQNHTNLSSLLLSKLVDMAPLWTTTPYLLAAQLGLPDILEALEQDPDVSTTEHQKEAIGLASRHDHQDLLDHLLAASPSHTQDAIDLSDTVRQASAYGYDKIVRKLVDYAKSTSTLQRLDLGKLICQAAMLGYKSQVKLFLQYEVDVNATDDGWTPLQLAVANGHSEVVDYLLEEGRADVNAKAGTETDPPILLAVERGYELIVQKLLNFNSDINMTRTPGEEHDTALHMAARQGHMVILGLLLSKAKADGTTEQFINGKDEQGRTPLMVACSEGNEGIAGLLLDHGACVDAGLDVDKHSILYHAAHPGISESFMKKIVKALGSMGTLGDIGDVFFEATKLGFTDIVADCLSENPSIKVGGQELVKHTDDAGRTALHHAADLGFYEIASLLLNPRHGTPVDPRDTAESTPLSLAAVSGNYAIVELLLERGADPFVTFNDDDGGGGTILNLIPSTVSVCTDGHVKSVINLLEKGVDPNSKDRSGRTPLHSAAAEGHVELVNVLLTHGIVPADVQAKGNWEWNALHYAANSNNPSACDIAELLIQHGIDPLSTEVDGWIPLHLAADANHSTSTDLLQFLWEKDRNSLAIRTNDGRTALHFGSKRAKSLVWILRHGGDVDAMDNKGATTLMLAASTRYDTAEAIRVLLENGSDPMLVDSNGKTALQLAAHMGGVKAGEALLKWPEDVTKLVSKKDPDNCSALHIALWDREPAFAEMLLDSFYAEATGDTIQDLSAVRESTGETPVLCAIKRGYQHLVKKLLDLGAETNARDKSGDTALLLAISEDDGSSLHLLLDPKRSTNRADVNAGDRVHPTALHQAANQGKMLLVRELVEIGNADVNAVGGKYHTALTAAVHAGETGIIDYLMKVGATQKPAQGNNDAPYLFYPLHAAIHSDHVDRTELISKLINAEPESVDFRDSQGRTALHIAMRHGSYDSVVDLFSCSAAMPDLYTTDYQGRTVLHHAVLGRSLELVQEVCLAWHMIDDKNKPLDVPDADGWTALHWACRLDDNVEIVTALIDARGVSAVTEATRDGWTPESISAFHGSGLTKSYFDEQISRLNGENNTEQDDGDDENGPGDAEDLDATESTGEESTSDATPSKSPPPGISEPPSEDPGESAVLMEETDDTEKEKNASLNVIGCWKVGEPNHGISCDGCFLFVSTFK